MTRLVSTLPLRRLAVAILVALLGSLAACDIGGAINNVADRAQVIAEETLTQLNNSIDALQSSSADWQKVLKDLESKLTDDLQKTVRNDVANLVSRTVAQSGVEFRCDLDFINRRIVEDL